MRIIKEYFKDADVVECLDTKTNFKYNDEFIKGFTDWSNMSLGKPTAKIYQSVEGGVLFKEPNTFAKIIKTI